MKTPEVWTNNSLGMPSSDICSSIIPFRQMKDYSPVRKGSYSHTMLHAQSKLLVSCDLSDK